VAFLSKAQRHHDPGNLSSIMDMQSGYWQVQMKPEDKEKTAFITVNGL
jgi:hypothetical protein